MALCLLLGAGAVALWRTRTIPPASPGQAIAILPFKPLVPASQDEALELGIADALINRLGASHEIVVRPIGSVRRYGGVEQDPVAAGRELGVEAVLDGTIHRVGNRIRVTARLVRVNDQRTLWSGQFDTTFNDIFAVQDSISDRVVSELALQLTNEERKLLDTRYRANTEAYDF